MCGCARRSSCVKEPEQRSERWKDPISSSITGSRAWTHFVRFTRQAESSRPSPALLCHRRLYRMEKSQQSTTDSKHDSQKLRSEWKKGVFFGGGHLNQFYFCLSLHALMYICCMVYIICRKSGRVDAQNCSSNMTLSTNIQGKISFCIRFATQIWWESSLPMRWRSKIVTSLSVHYRAIHTARTPLKLP